MKVLFLRELGFVGSRRVLGACDVRVTPERQLRSPGPGSSAMFPSCHTMAL